MSQEYCSLCHITVAPSDPERRVRGKKDVVHLSCILSREGKAIVAECEEFLKGCLGARPARTIGIETGKLSAAVRAFSAGAGKATNAKKVAELLFAAFKEVWSLKRSRPLHRRMCAFAAKAGERLTVRVRVPALEPAKTESNGFAN